MTDITSLSYTVITLFIVVIVSFAATKLKLVSENFTKGFSTFIICVAQPFMIVDSLSHVEFSLENLKRGFTVTGLGFISLAICAAVGFIATKPFRNEDDRKIGTFALVFANTGFMGIPVLKALFGDIGAFYGAFFMITFQVVLWTYGMILLGRGRDDIKVKPLNLIFNYGTVPCIIGIILYVLPFDLLTGSFIGFPHRNIHAACLKLPECLIRKKEGNRVAAPDNFLSVCLRAV